MRFMGDSYPIYVSHPQHKTNFQRKNLLLINSFKKRIDFNFD